MKGKTEEGGEESLCVLQLTEAGDIFYQIIESEQPDIASPSATEDELLQMEEAKRPEKPWTDSQTVVSETSEDEGLIPPTPDPTAQKSIPETPKKITRGADIYTDTDSEDSESEGWRKRKQRQLNLQVFVNSDPDPDTRNGSDQSDDNGAPGNNNHEEPENMEGTVDSRSPGHVQAEVQLSDSALGIWKHWLKKLIKKSFKENPQPHLLQHFEVDTDNIFPPEYGRKRLSEKRLVEKLRGDLRACISKPSLLVYNSVSDSVTAPDVEPLPKTVDTDAWEDQLSQRLTLSWQGEKAWREWWENSLGLNAEQRKDALRRKRRREKDAKRASGRRLELSGSFTSSISYQSDFSDFSDYRDWSSATSQELWSDAETIRSQPESFTESVTSRAASPPETQTDGPAPATPQSFKSKPDEQQTPSRSHTPPLTPRTMATRSSLRTNKRSAEDTLSSLVRVEIEVF